MNDITSIRNRQRFDQSNPCNADGVFNWNAFTIIDGKSCFPRRITPMDIDFNVEIKQQHVIIESKDENVPIPSGQMQALDSLVDTHRVTLICMWGKINPTSWSVKTRSEPVMPILRQFRGAKIVEWVEYGPMAILEQRPTDCVEVHDFLTKWSTTVDARRGY